MDHVAIDLGGRESQICVRGSDGKVVKEQRVATAGLGLWLGRLEPSRVVVETCAEAFTVAEQARAAGHEVVVVPATLVRQLGVGDRKTKTDRRDAQVLSRASCGLDQLPSVHVPSSWAREAKSACGMREVLVASRTMQINAVRGWLRTSLLRLPKSRSYSFPQRVRELLESKKVPIPLHVELELEGITALSGLIARADQAIERLADGDERCRRLMTVPGVGPVTSVRFVAALDETPRFCSAHKVESYLGLVPGQDSSSDKVRHTAITKAGSTSVRWVLVQACWSLRRCRPDDPLVRWSRQVEQRRGKGPAVVAMARKLAGILFAMLRDGTTYQPARTSTLGNEILEQERQQVQDAVAQLMATPAKVKAAKVKVPKARARREASTEKA